MEKEYSLIQRSFESMLNSTYTDEELRALCLNHAVKLVDTEWSRARGECNTKTILAVTTELMNIVKYGTIEAPTDATAPVATPAPAVQAA